MAGTNSTIPTCLTCYSEDVVRWGSYCEFNSGYKTVYSLYRNPGGFVPSGDVIATGRACFCRNCGRIFYVITYAAGEPRPPDL